MRSKILHALSEEKKTVFYKRFIGQILRVLTEEKDAEGRWTGYADNYIKVKIENSLNVQANQFVNVKIHEVGGEFAIGQTIATKRHKKKQDMVGV